MKAFFSRSSAKLANSPSSPSSPTSSPSSSYKDPLALPPFTPPLPDRKLSLHVTPDGLLIVPRHHHHHHGHRKQPSADAAATGLESPATATGARLRWSRDANVEQMKAEELNASLKSQVKGCTIECYGIVGKLKLFQNSYLLVITRREHSGDFLHASRPVYRCVGVLGIPLTKDGAERVLKQEAERAPGKTVTSSSSSSATSSGEDSDEEDEEDPDSDVQTPSIVTRESFIMSNSRSDTGIDPRNTSTLRASDSKKWLSHAGAKSASEAQIGTGKLGEQGTVGPDAPVAQPDSVHAEVTNEATHDPASTAAASSSSKEEEAMHDANKAELEDKLVKEATRQFARGELYFSYDFDLTTPLQRKHEQLVKANGGKTAPQPTAPSSNGSSLPPFEEPRPTLPLWRRVDRRFFHNEHMLRDFIAAGAHSLVLPLMQGYFQTSSLPLPASSGGEADSSAQLMIISRRSRERPGLRYQRRGVNSDGQVANYVETEQVLLVHREEQTHLFSFVQFRGSIPLYWSQSPFSLKPPPILERSSQENKRAFAAHFKAQVERYGKVTCVNLAEQSGKEGEITAAYQKGVEELRDDKVKYLAFDFHKECAGMKFENVSRLIERLDDTLQEMGFFWRSSGGVSTTTTAGTPPTISSSSSSPDGLLSKQFGTFRVSCLDCLDRSGVAASAFGRHMLLSQLASLGIAVQPKDNPAFDYAFNDAWANNGDQISQCYAGSRALKGDFTRTGRRNWTGVFNDATASVYRLVQGAVTDFWRQTVISFVYGELSLSGLEKYGEELQSVDPSNEVRLARVRAAAIETCAGMVLAPSTNSGKSDGEGDNKVSAEDEGEIRIGGWTLFSPHETNRVQSTRLEEKVVLLTNKSLYICAYDFTADKLSEYSRILLGDITALQKGEYILSPKEGVWSEQHWGLVVYYLRQDTRVNVASIKNVPPAVKEKGKGENFICLKAVADEFSGTLERERDPPVAAATAPTPKESQASRWKLGGGKVCFSAEKQKQSNVTASTISTSSVESTASTLRSSRVTRSAPEDHADLTSKNIVEAIVQMLTEECAATGACSLQDVEANTDGGSEESEKKDNEVEGEGFIRTKPIQTLEQAKAQAPLFGGLIEGLKRRVWL